MVKIDTCVVFYGIPLDDIKSMVEEFLPAHLDCIFDFRNLQWNTIDGKNNTFNTIDSKNLTWDEIDTFDEI